MNSELEQMIVTAMQSMQTSEGWVNLADLGNALHKLSADFTPQRYGFAKLFDMVEALHTLLEKRVDVTRIVPVIYVRLIPNKHAEDNTPVIDLLKWAYLRDLRTTLMSLRDLALEEQWSFANQDSTALPHRILLNYLGNTFYRLVMEGKVMELRSEVGPLAAFNTGLVDKRYEPIYAFFRENKKLGYQKWYLSSFCIAGEERDGKDLVRYFNPKPQTAQYFNSIRDTLYDVNVGAPEIDWQHVIVENVDRLPAELIEDHCPAEFVTQNVNLLTKEQKWTYFTELKDALKRDTRAYRAIKNRLADALDLAIKRVRWNYKTAIPTYYPKTNRMTLLLPLAVITDDKVDVALVVEKTESGNYLGHTILPLDWAYNNARLVCRPDSDWLVPSAINTSAAPADEAADLYAQPIVA